MVFVQRLGCSVFVQRWLFVLRFVWFACKCKQFSDIKSGACPVLKMGLSHQRTLDRLYVIDGGNGVGPSSSIHAHERSHRD